MEKADRREQILSSAVAVFGKKGYHDTAISDIIERAGIARGTFYLYFTSKRAIFDDILERSFTRILGQLRPVTISRPLNREHILEQIGENARRLAKLVADEAELFSVLLSEAGGLDRSVRQKLARFYDRLGAWIAESLEEGIRRGIVRRCDTELAAHALLGMCRGIFWAWSIGMLPLDEDGFVAEALGLMCSGLLIVGAETERACVPSRARRVRRAAKKPQRARAR